ncbi:VanW family protein [Paenibacillus melissococcoides]|uniref:VanW family protein n=1 Tax=Paenibacillus melissococcoides TaxID=2912268 RepID=A0ABM9FY75_9BACL|nr:MULTISPECIES: VanW family protein [Paenibacillus]MEB9893675.1 VanW family protein [Bacillus cereus]CAH8244179.1 VanW family protein [Paenibacillus melissococcoides]CAH8703711.1 VanW family protein [Paenibacillus melissococcoides]CAH8706221.1 VanW family protein [Paenibacillus melissococcoides]
MQGRSVATVNRADYMAPVFPLLADDKIDRLLDDLDKKMYHAPRNARIGDHEEIIPEQNGYKLDRDRFREQFYSFLYGSGSLSIEAPRLKIHAKVDSELLAHIRDKRIGHYVTFYNSRNKNRSHNVALAAQAINNTVVFPGEHFSFNRVVGMRTTAKGYRQAPIIVRGEFSEGIGGGICQVSSTLFNAVDRAGLVIKQRYSHSRNVPYVPPGRDATVSWGGPDFAFQNLYNQPVLIRAHAGGGQMTVAVYSSELINHKPREVPGTTRRLPEEIIFDLEAKAKE